MAGRVPSARALLAVVGAAGVLVLGLPPVQPAAAAEPCVGVIVDARLLGGEVRTGCAEGDPDSGLEALTMAGFSYAFVPRQPGLVCQIDGLPECHRTTTTTYWSYWYRAKGSDRWVYAAQGAGAHDPEPGATEAWVWQEGGRREPPGIGLRTICPQVAAPAPRKSTAAPSPEPDRTERPATRPADTAQPTRRDEKNDPARRTAGKAARSSPPATSAPPSTSAAAASSPATTTSSPATTTSSPATTTSSAAAAPTTSPVARRTDGGASGGAPWAGLGVGAGLVAALGAAAVLRGRRSGGSP